MIKNYPFEKNKILVSGHRGLRIYGIENTMVAFRMAIGYGVDMLETDVRMTWDGHLILMHDDTVDRTTNGKGRVRDMTLSQIKKLDATVNKKIDVTPEPPPTLAEFLELMKLNPRILLNIELKDYPEDGEELAYECADKICRMLIEYDVKERTWINSFSGRLLEYVYKKYGNVFFYHGFYPWFILGEMSIPPESFIDVACMQHRIKCEDGRIEKCTDNMCPEEWFHYLISKGIMPLMAPSLKEYPLYEKAFSYGSRIANVDDPKKMLEHLRQKGLHN